MRAPAQGSWYYPVVSDDFVERLTEVVAREPRVVLAYLFGSRAGGRPRPDSDVDLALAYRADLDDSEREVVRSRPVVALADASGALGARAATTTKRPIAGCFGSGAPRGASHERGNAWSMRTLSRTVYSR